MVIISWKSCILRGNPCTDYPEYREFVLATLPQLHSLDGQELTRTEKLLALRKLQRNRKNVVQRQTEYQIQRDNQKIRVQRDLEDAKMELESVNDDEERVRRSST